MMNISEQTKAKISRLLGLIGLFWSTFIPALGIPFFVAGILVSFKTRYTNKEQYFNFIFNIICLLSALLLFIIMIIKVYAN